MLDVSTLNVSFTFIAVCAMVPFLAGAWIGPLRGKLDLLRGHGESADLFYRIRVHGNFVENAPIVALVLLVAEASGVSDTWLWATVAAFVVGRIGHALRYDHKDRAFGMLLTTGPAVGLGIAVLAGL